MHPFLRNVVIGVVGLLVAGGLMAIAVFGTDSGSSVLAMLAAGILGTVVGGFLFVQGWIWSQRAWRRGYTGPICGDRGGRRSDDPGCRALAGGDGDGGGALLPGLRPWA